MNRFKFKIWDSILGIMYLPDIGGLIEDVKFENGIFVVREGVVLLQCTGFKDCKGVDIYEGDIIEFDKREWRGDDNIHTVSWDEEEGAWRWGGGSSADIEWRTVIGNIYEHPHLVE